VVVADRGGANREVVRVPGQAVLVQEDLLLAARLPGGGQLVAPASRPAAMDGVVLSLLGARVVPPGSPPGRHRHVGLLDARLHLLEEGVAQPAEPGCLLLGVGILGLEVGQDLGILAFAEPVPGVLPVVAVGRHDVVPPGRHGRPGRGRLLVALGGLR
jgi:hypothetical protein